MARPIRFSRCTPLPGAIAVALIGAGALLGGMAPACGQRKTAPQFACAEVRVTLTGAINGSGVPTVITAAALSRELEQTYASIRAQRNVAGAVVLALFVDARGKVKKSVVVESSGYKVLDIAALGAASHALFSPAIEGEQAVGGWTLLPVEFRSN